MERLVLIGFMGSGKTTLGNRLAESAGVPFVDLDVELERRSGCSIRDLIAARGEAAFRALEVETLRALLEEAPPACVLATGGGIVETPEGRALLPRSGRVVWLRADPRACVSRLGAARTARPLLDPGADWMSRWVRREPWYRQLAAAIVDTHPQDVGASLAQLRELLAACGSGEA